MGKGRRGMRGGGAEERAAKKKVDKVLPVGEAKQQMYMIMLPLPPAWVRRAFSLAHASGELGAMGKTRKWSGLTL